MLAWTLVHVCFFIEQMQRRLQKDTNEVPTRQRDIIKWPLGISNPHWESQNAQKHIMKMSLRRL